MTVDCAGSSPLIGDPSAGPSSRLHVDVAVQCDLLEIRDQKVEPDLPTPADRYDEAADVPFAGSCENSWSLQGFEAEFRLA